MPNAPKLRSMTVPRPAGPIARRGFSLIEAMVALLVLSTGLIGTAALHGHSLGASRTAQLRTHAVVLASDVADRIRANRLAVTAYGAGADDRGCDPQSGAVRCTATEVAVHDLFDWRTLLADHLPGGSGTVSVNGATHPPTYTIAVTWDEAWTGRAEYLLVVQVPEY